MSWNEANGTVSRAFDDWRFADEDIRSYLKVSMQLSNTEYQRRWDESMSSLENGDPDDAIEGLGLLDYQWMLLSSVVKDAVTAFEVYLEEATNEVRQAHGLADLKGRRSPYPDWGALRDFYQDYLGVSIDSVEVKRIRNLRHLLTHNRGELRTKEQGKTFGNHGDVFPSDQAKLSREEVLEGLEEPGDVVCRVDPTVWRFAWSRDQVPSLLVLRPQGSP